MPDLLLSHFRFEVTPSLGHACCGGWITPVLAVDDPLYCHGFVLTGCDSPIVVCAVDWTGLFNEAHLAWRVALAEAAGTTPDRVAVQCVHQHNAPLACLDAARIVAEQGDLPRGVDLEFFNECLDRAGASVTQSVHRARPVTHIASGRAQVEKFASNRRVHRDEEGFVIATRNSRETSESMRELPEGLIDPWLKTVAFYDGDLKIAACHYYATHPMSYYGDGRVSSDTVGLARKRRQEDEPDCAHIYFTGCAGNIAAGKYNDGSPERRPILSDRIYDGMVRAERELRPEPISEVSWSTTGVIPKVNDALFRADLEETIRSKTASVMDRCRSSYMLSWRRRIEQKIPLGLSFLRINGIGMLHLPAECFVEYQLRAQKMARTQFLATAAYGDGGPWYIPVKEEYGKGGYELTVAFCDPEVDDLITRGMRELLHPMQER